MFARSPIRTIRGFLCVCVQRLLVKTSRYHALFTDLNEVLGS